MENNVVSTAGALVIKNGTVLLVKHGKSAGHLDGKYGLPAGRIEKGEDIKEAVYRELKEETGLAADPDSLILLPGVWFADIERKSGTEQFSLKVFLVDKVEGWLSGSAETVPEWINIEDLKKYDLLPNVSDIITEGLKTAGAK
ncbi:MAG TPA: NUDIX hydrolase [Candidatus Paceibacterota bacterium]|nr:NUDIX hydrolase [Candidatus Pacearchaeota archaeon]HRZ50659.1 NUDIX hydrolase [Candidatus Paceibacterota bacterium]HSA36444.1 NUDIX hydrolase [Candidatus Paceibacterota bacterium]